MLLKQLLTFFLSLFLSHILLGQTYYIEDFGGIADGKTNNSSMIQSAIDMAAAKGGGKVVLDSGIYLSGSIRLKSGVHLQINKSATLLGSTEIEDYLKIRRWKALILADGVENISISGGGIIDGQGDLLALKIDSLFYEGEIDSSDYNFKDRRPKANIRPQLIEFVYCRNISIKNIQLKHAASWVQTYFRCFDLEVDSMHVDSDTYWNNDGIDLVDCKKARITNSFFNASDDAICLKSYRIGFEGEEDPTYYCDNIYISNCKIRSSASALKFGTTSYKAFSNILIENIEVYDTYRSAIALESVHNAAIENVIIRNIEAKNTGNALFIRLGGKPKQDHRGYFKNVLIENVYVEIARDIADKYYRIRGPALPFFHNTFPSSITGIPSNKISGLRLKNIEIKYPGGGDAAYAHMPLNRLTEVPEHEEMYPEFSMFGELPAWGLYIRHAEGIEIKDLRLTIDKEDYRPAIVLDDVDAYKFGAIHIEGDEKEIKLYQNGKGVLPLPKN